MPCRLSRRRRPPPKTPANRGCGAFLSSSLTRETGKLLPRHILVPAIFRALKWGCTPPYQRIPVAPMSSRKRARPSAAKGKKSGRSTPTRLQIRLEKTQYEGLLAACREQDTDASALIRSWVDYLLKPPGSGRKITGMAAPGTFKDDPRALVSDARLHVTMDDSILKRLRHACRALGIAHSRVVRGCVAKILELHEQGKELTPPPIRTRCKR